MRLGNTAGAVSASLPASMTSAHFGAEASDSNLLENELSKLTEQEVRAIMLTKGDVVYSSLSLSLKQKYPVSEELPFLKPGRNTRRLTKRAKPPIIKSETAQALNRSLRLINTLHVQRSAIDVVICKSRITLHQSGASISILFEVSGEGKQLWKLRPKFGLKEQDRADTIRAASATIKAHMPQVSAN